MEWTLATFAALKNSAWPWITCSTIRGRIPGTGGLERVVFNEKLWEIRRESILRELQRRIRDAGAVGQRGLRCAV